MSHGGGCASGLPALPRGPLPVRIVLELPACRVEGISHGYISVFVLLPVDNDFMPRDFYVDSYRKRVSALLSPGRRLDGDAAAGDAIAHVLQFGRLFPDELFQPG